MKSIHWKIPNKKIIRVNNQEKTMMNGNGSGSIDVTAGDDTWQYEWPELNESVKTTVSFNQNGFRIESKPENSLLTVFQINSKLDEMGIEGGLDENNQFNFKISGSSLNQVSKTRKTKTSKMQKSRNCKSEEKN